MKKYNFTIAIGQNSRQPNVVHGEFQIDFEKGTYCATAKTWYENAFEHLRYLASMSQYKQQWENRIPSVALIENVSAHSRKILVVMGDIVEANVILNTDGAFKRFIDYSMKAKLNPFDYLPKNGEWVAIKESINYDVTFFKN